MGQATFVERDWIPSIGLFFRFSLWMPVLSNAIRLVLLHIDASLPWCLMNRKSAGGLFGY